MRIVRIVSTTAMVIAVSVAFLFGPFVFIPIFGVIGGGAIALLLHWKALPAGSDPFAGRGPTEIVNVSSVRVAGIGGLGLVVVALAMVFQFNEAALLMASGVIGGIIVAAVLVIRRQRHGVLPSSGDRGNSMLVTERIQDGHAVQSIEETEPGTDRVRYALVR